jgi:hypothetical protein
LRFKNTDHGGEILAPVEAPPGEMGDAEVLEARPDIDAQPGDPADEWDEAFDEAERNGTVLPFGRF